MRLMPLCRILAVSAAALLAACGEDSDTKTLPDTSHDIDPAAYSGPPPATADVAAFKQFVWNNLATANRCGNCHGTGGQSPQFVRDDDINLAYAAANTVADLVDPEDSRLVERVDNGHHCWSDDTDICAEVMTTYIRNWAQATVGGPASEVVLTAPPEHIPGATKNFPPDSTLFGNTVWPVVNEYCAGCHAPDADNPQAPFFAQDDIESAYAAARNTIDLNDPADSRLVQRLRNEFHNCWDDCAANAGEMQEAVEAMADNIVVTPLPPETIASRALGLREGIVASSGGRHEANVIAKYEFKEAGGTLVHDTSGISPALDLTLTGAATWVGGWGVRFDGGKAQGSTLNSRKLHDLLGASGEYSIEAWIAPANVTQEGPARIVSYSGGDDVRNFMLGQSMYNYDFLNRNDDTDGNGEPALSTADADQRLQATLQHVVVTYTASGGRRIHVNGEYTGDVDPAGPGTFAGWNNSFALVLGSEVDGTSPWRGVIRLLAVHSRALNDEQIAQNFEAGVGERFFLLFAIGHLIDEPDTYVLFEGSQFDSYSYLLAAPRVISLDPAFSPGSIPLAGMRIGINGGVPTVGQAYGTLDTTVDDGQWIPGTGQLLSRLGTAIPLENGPDFDQFFLTFERLGDQENVSTPSMSPAPPLPVGAPVPDIGLRLFDTINAALSEITGIPVNDPAVADMYLRVKQQLPASDLITGFSSAQQIGITQLAIEYCNTLVEDPVSSIYFAGFNLDAPYNTALDSAGERSALIDPLVLHVANTSLLTMPDIVDINTELDALITRLVDSCTGACAADPVGRTQTIAKAVCTAASANAAMLIQ
ncbi:MAG: LamG-like jellyroll fold domain-containing protein [Pseudomonadota bacterium]